MIAARTVIISSFAPTRGRTGGCAGFRCAECDPSVIGDLFAMHEPVPAIADLECDPPRRRVGKARPVDDSGCRPAAIARPPARTRRSGDLPSTHRPPLLPRTRLPARLAPPPPPP